MVLAPVRIPRAEASAHRDLRKDLRKDLIRKELEDLRKELTRKELEWKELEGLIRKELEELEGLKCIKWIKMRSSHQNKLIC